MTASEPIVTITDLIPTDDGRTAITYTVDYNGSASGVTLADLGTEPTVADAIEFITSLYV